MTQSECPLANVTLLPHRSDNVYGGIVNQRFGVTFEIIGLTKKDGFRFEMTVANVLEGVSILETPPAFSVKCYPSATSCPVENQKTTMDLFYFVGLNETSGVIPFTLTKLSPTPPCKIASIDVFIKITKPQNLVEPSSSTSFMNSVELGLIVVACMSCFLVVIFLKVKEIWW